VKTLSKSSPLLQHLAKGDAQLLKLPFAEIQMIPDAPLPPSAGRHSAWWSWRS